MKSFLFGLTVLLLLQGFLGHFKAHANVGQDFGFGAQVMSLGGAGVGWNTQGFAGYHNPAALSESTTDSGQGRRLVLSWGLVFIHPQFLSIQNILLQNGYIADEAYHPTSAQPQTSLLGDGDTSSYRNTFGQTLGFTYQLAPEFYHLSVGVVTFFPIEQLAYMDTGHNFEPEYVLYRSRTQRPQVDVGLGARFSNGLAFGLGFHSGFDLTGNGTLFITTQNNTVSTMRFTASMKPKLAPYVGIYFSPHEEQREHQSYSLGAVVRAPMSSENILKFSSGARVFGSFAAVDFNFDSKSTLFYDPLSFELGGMVSPSSGLKMMGQVDYQVWSQYKTPALIISQAQTSRCTSSNPADCPGGGLKINPGANPDQSYRNILVPRLGVEKELSEGVALRLGYAYRPSILRDLPTGAGNYLDPSKHQLNLGMGFEFKRFLSYDFPARVDVALTYHLLKKDHVIKTPGTNEAGVSNDQKIGYPGYDSGGKLYGGAVTLSLLF
jgi:hypothetical protein